MLGVVSSVGRFDGSSVLMEDHLRLWKLACRDCKICKDVHPTLI